MGQYANQCGEPELKKFGFRAWGFTLNCPKCGSADTKANGGQAKYQWHCMVCDYCFNRTEANGELAIGQYTLNKLQMEEVEAREYFKDSINKIVGYNNDVEGKNPSERKGEENTMAKRMTKAQAEKLAAELGKGHNIAKDEFGHFFVLGPKADKFVPKLNKEGETIYDPNTRPGVQMLIAQQEAQDKTLEENGDKVEKTEKSADAEDKGETIGRKELDKTFGKHITGTKLMEIFPEHQKNGRWAFTPEDVEKVRKALEADKKA